MSLFNFLLHQGAKALGDMVTDAIVNGQTDQQEKEDNRTFDGKLSEVLQKLGPDYEIRRDISPKELEQEAGQQIYPRGGNYCEPDKITYEISVGGQRVLLINLWRSYEHYKHTANRKIREYCGTHNIRMLDFFDYLPNRADYMEERIQKQLG